MLDVLQVRPYSYIKRVYQTSNGTAIQVLQEKCEIVFVAMRPPADLHDSQGAAHACGNEQQ